MYPSLPGIWMSIRIRSGCPRRQRGEEFVAADDAGDLVALEAQQGAEELHVVRTVFDDQDRCHASSGRVSRPAQLRALFAAPGKDTIPAAESDAATNAGASLARSSRNTVAGTHRVPGDKSITHRALMLAALAPGASTLHGALTSEDARSTARVLRQLGAAISPLRAGGAVTVQRASAVRRAGGPRSTAATRGPRLACCSDCWRHTDSLRR